MANSPGLIDSGYRDELCVIVINTDPIEAYEVRRGDRIAQLVIQRVEQRRFAPVDELPASARGTGGFGHTGVLSDARAARSRGPGRFLAEQWSGHAIERVEVAALSALKTYDPPLESLTGPDRRRRGTAGQVPGLRHRRAVAGRSTWPGAAGSSGGTSWRPPGPSRARARWPCGSACRRGRASTSPSRGPRSGWPSGSSTTPTEVDGVARLGPDPLDPGFDVAALAALLAGQGRQPQDGADRPVGARRRRQRLLRRGAPRRPAVAVQDGGQAHRGGDGRLHAALVGVLADAVERSQGLPAKGLKGEKRSGLAVHGRTGEPCPVCGDIVREVSFATKSLQYCPTCQTGGKPLADRRLSRLLK